MRLLSLWRLYATMDLLLLARGPQVTITYYLSDFVIGVAAVTATFLLAQRFDGIGIWTRPQVLFLLGYALLVRMLIDTFFNWNLAHISRRIGRGQLDHLLVQPQPLWMSLLSEGFSPFSGTGMLLPSGFLLISAGRELQLGVTPTWVGLLVVDLLASVTIVMSFEYALGSLAFWVPRAAEELNSQTWALLMTLAPFPLDGLPGWTVGGLLTLVPAGLVAWYPSRALLGLEPPSWGSTVVVPAAALVFASVATGIFLSGLQHYGRTGSSRYLDHGHRR